MENIIQQISPAIISSKKIRVRLENGERHVVNPHIVLRKKHGDEILKTMLDSGDCLDIPLEKIRDVAVLSDSFAIDTSCLQFDYREYEIVFPKKSDWFERAGT